MAKSLVICDQCGIEFLKENGHIKTSKKHFCSLKCYGLYNSLKTLEKEIGKKHGKLTIISFDYIKNGNSYVNCICDCGAECIKRLSHLKSKNTISCGKCRGETVKERFMSYVNIVDSKTWIWEGGKSKGYGTFFYKGKSRSAHRMSYQLFKGKIPPNMCVCHGYDDNPLNICPNNLWLGDNQDNMDDMVKKGRSLKGEELASSRLSEKEVIEIRKLYDSENYMQKTLAEKFNISKSVIGSVVRREIWRHIL